MIHYIYKIIFLRGFPTGRYYLGKRSFNGNDLSEDSYSGSGSFCKAYFKAYGKRLGDTYLKEILEINPSSKINSDREITVIGDLWKTDPLCMNLMPGGGGGDNTEAKAVLQYDIDGNFIEAYPSECRAAEAVGLLNSSGISDSCIRKTYTSKGFIWRFANEPLKKSELSDIIIHSKPVKQYNEDGEFLRDWPSAKSAETALQINAGSIIAVCRHSNKKRHTAGGFIWSYYNEPPVYNKQVPYRGKKKVKQYDLNGVFLKEFNSLKEAADSVQGNWQCIQSCCNKKTSSAYKYVWRFNDDLISKKEIELAQESNRRFIIQKIDKDGNIIDIFDGPTEAGKSIGVPYQHIQRAIKTGKCCHEYYWKRIEVIS